MATVPGMPSRSVAVCSSFADPQSLMSPAPTRTGSAAATGAGATTNEAVSNAVRVAVSASRRVMGFLNHTRGAQPGVKVTMCTGSPRSVQPDAPDPMTSG